MEAVVDPFAHLAPSPALKARPNQRSGHSATEVTTGELIQLGAVDTEFYARTFFPKTYRQKSPGFAREVWELLEDPSVRMANLVIFRGASKTTRLRTFASKRMAYGVSRTILYIGASERDAIRSVTWLKHQVERNTHWAQTFGLMKGAKWEETQIEVIHKGFSKYDSNGILAEPFTIWILAAGITGSLRGINFDDYRPDLIVVDDPQTDEMAASLEQREKVADLIFGAVRNSLASRVEEPNAKLVMAITPQHMDDISQRALKDAEFTSKVFPCWTQATMDLPVDSQQSVWPELHPTEDLRAEKRNAVRRNKLSVFSREKECRLISTESAVFMRSWLKVREPDLAIRGAAAVLAIDPVPPPSQREMERGLLKKDWEAHYVWGRYRGEYHLLDFARSRGHDPSWTIATFFRLMRQWHCYSCVFDATSYQRSIKFMLEQEMARRRIWYTVVPYETHNQPKYARISGVISPLVTQGLIWIGQEHNIFAQQYEEYGPTYSGPDDDLDASAMALLELSKPWLEAGAIGEGEAVESISWNRGAP